MVPSFPVRASLTVAELCAVIAATAGLVPAAAAAGPGSTSAVGDLWRLFYRFTTHAAAAPQPPPGLVAAATAPPPPSTVLAVPVGSGGFAVPLEQFLRPRLLAAPQLHALLAAERGGAPPPPTAASAESQAALTVSRLLGDVREQLQAAVAAARGQQQLPLALQLQGRPAVLVMKRRVYVSPYTPPVYRVAPPSASVGGAMSPRSNAPVQAAAGGQAPPVPQRSALVFPGGGGGSGLALGQPVDSLHLPPLLLPPSSGPGGGRPAPVPSAALRVGSVRERALLFAQVRAGRQSPAPSPSTLSAPLPLCCSASAGLHGLAERAPRRSDSRALRQRRRQRHEAGRRLRPLRGVPRPPRRPRRVAGDCAAGRAGWRRRRRGDGAPGHGRRRGGDRSGGQGRRARRARVESLGPAPRARAAVDLRVGGGGEQRQAEGAGSSGSAFCCCTRHCCRGANPWAWGGGLKHVLPPFRFSTGRCRAAPPSHPRATHSGAVA